MSIEILRPGLEEAKKFVLPCSPTHGMRVRDFSVSSDSSRWRDDVLRLLNADKQCGRKVSTMVLSEARGL